MGGTEGEPTACDRPASPRLLRAHEVHLAPGAICLRPMTEDDWDVLLPWNSDPEVLYYCEGNFMSRKGIDQWDLTLHPFGLPHGPQPGATEASIGVEGTKELAVMVDTFNPLHLTTDALALEKSDYMASWLEGDDE